MQWFKASTTLTICTYKSNAAVVVLLWCFMMMSCCHWLPDLNPMTSWLRHTHDTYMSVNICVSTCNQRQFRAHIRWSPTISSNKYQLHDQIFVFIILIVLLLSQSWSNNILIKRSVYPALALQPINLQCAADAVDKYRRNWISLKLEMLIKKLWYLLWRTQRLGFKYHIILCNILHTYITGAYAGFLKGDSLFRAAHINFMLFGDITLSGPSILKIL